MTIKARNIIVGGTKLSTITERKKFFKELLASKQETVKEEPKQQPKKEPHYAQRQIKNEAKPKEASHYLKKTDGVLIRHINKKSTYLSDMLEIES
jgi:hypothetical protein